MSDKTESWLVHRRFSKNQPTNEQTNLFCLLFCFSQQTNQIHLFVFWKICCAPIDSWFYLTFKFWSSKWTKQKFLGMGCWIYFCLPCWNCHLVRKDMGLHLHCLGRVPPLHATHAQCLKKLMAPFSQLNNGFYSTFSLRLDI